MKHLLISLIVLTSTNVFADFNCTIKTLFGENGARAKTLATYKNIDNSSISTTSTLILADGSVIKNFNSQTIPSEQELKGSKLVTISAGSDELELYVASPSKVTTLNDFNASMALGDLESRKVGLKDLNNNLSVICTQ